MEKQPNFTRAWRDHYGLTQQQLAERMHITVGAISKVENGVNKASFEWRERLAKALGNGVSAEDISAPPPPAHNTSLTDVSQDEPPQRDNPSRREHAVRDLVRRVQRKLVRRYGPEIVVDEALDAAAEEPEPALNPQRRRGTS